MIVAEIAGLVIAYIIGYACVLHVFERMGFSKRTRLLLSIGSWLSAFMIVVIMCIWEIVNTFKTKDYE